MKRKLTSFAAAGALLIAGAGFSAAQAQGSWAGAQPVAQYYGGPYYGYDYGWGPGPIGAIIAAPAVAAAGILGAAATVAAAPVAAAAALGSAPYAAGYYADPYYDFGYYGAGYYGPGYAPIGWGDNYGPTYVAYRNGPLVRRAAVVTRGPYRTVRVAAPARSLRAHPAHMRPAHAPVRMHRVQNQNMKVASK